MPPPLYRPKVFISHSAKDPLARRLMDSLADALNATGKFDILLDKRALEPSDEWRAAIDEWILRCDAAVIILSKDAVESQYVLYETTLLRGRWKTRKDFTLIPIRFADVTTEMLEDAMGPLQLGEIQHVLVSREAGDGDAKVAEETTRRVLELLKPLPDRFAGRHEFEDALTTILYHQVATDEGLEEINKQLLGGTMMAGAKRDKAVALARALLELDEARGVGRFVKIEPVMERMHNIISNVGFVRRVINIVTPFCWVDPETALNLLVIAARESQPRLVAWRRRWSLSEEMHLCRGYCSRGFKLVVVSDSCSGQLKDDLEHVRRCLGERLCRDQDATEERIKTLINDLEAEGKPTFLVMPAKPVDGEFIKALQAQWRRVTFIFHDRGLTKEQMTAWGLGQAVFLEPLLDPKAEDTAFARWGALLELTGVDSDLIDQGRAFLQ